MADEETADSDDLDRMADLVGEAGDLIAIEGVWSGRILHTAVELGMFDVLTDEPVPAKDLASELDLEPDNTYRLLRSMAYFDVLDEDDDRRFSLTPLGELFRADHPHSVRDDLMFNRSPEWALAMLHLPDVVAGGGPAGFVREFGCGFFEYVKENPEFGERYGAIIEYASRDHPDQVLGALDAYDLSRFSHVCDVGGGSGRLLCHILDANPHLQGTVFELPSVVDGDHPHRAETLDVADRCSYVAGDMFEAVPEADAYVLKWILHNFDDEACRRVLANVREAAPDEGRLFVIESVVPGPETPHPAKRLDIAMMVQVGGRERTEDGYSTLLGRAGWDLVETWHPDAGPLSVLEAVKA